MDKDAELKKFLGNCSAIADRLLKECPIRGDIPISVVRVMLKLAAAEGARQELQEITNYERITDRQPSNVHPV